jgi:hypothetical protein
MESDGRLFVHPPRTNGDLDSGAVVKLSCNLKLSRMKPYVVSHPRRFHKQLILKDGLALPPYSLTQALRKQ